MNEKVLGFKEKDAVFFSETESFNAWIEIKQSKLVPVVSLEWLEKKCKINKLNDCDVVEEQTENNNPYYVRISTLLSAARKEAKKK